MFVSIIIPTYNRSNSLSITLESLLNQTYPKEMFEILVVDNKSTDDTAEIIKEWEIKSEGLIKYYAELRQGSHYARNAAVQQAKGDLLYFTDDDMITEPKMLAELVKLFTDHPELGSATGRVLPHWKKEPPLWLKKYFVNGWLSLYDRDDDVFISKDDFGVFSCHQAVLKDAFKQAGGYNPDIIDGEWLGDNETGLNIKIQNLGFEFGFVKSAVTYHIIPESRITQQYFNKRFGNQGNCDSYTDYRKYRYNSSELKHNILKYRKQILHKFAKFVLQFILRNDKWHINRAWVNYYQHRIVYEKRLLNDNEWKNMVLIDDWINI